MEQQRILNSLIVLLVFSIITNAVLYLLYKKQITKKEQSDKYIHDFITCIHPSELIILLEKKIDLIMGSVSTQISLSQILITKFEDYFMLKDEILFGNIDLALIQISNTNNEFLKRFSSECCKEAIRQLYRNQHEKLITSFVTSIQQNSASGVRKSILMTMTTPDRISLTYYLNEEIKKRLEGIGLDENQRTCLELGKLTVIKDEQAVLI